MADITGKATERGSVTADGGYTPASAGVHCMAEDATSLADAPLGDAPFQDRIHPGEEARRLARWGPRYLPRIEGGEERRQFSQLCERILIELDEFATADYLIDGKVSDEGAGVIAEIANLLECLFDCPFGEGESLRSVVVAIQSQTNNADWTRQIIDFLRDTMMFLRVRYVVNDQTVDEVYEIMKEHGLDPFRGSVSDRDIKTRYRLVEVKDH